MSMNIPDRTTDAPTPNTDRTVLYSKNGLLTTIDDAGVVRVAMGDMTKDVYDPNTVEGDVFDIDNMVESVTNAVMLKTERTELFNIQAANSVYVHELSDFPTPSGGKITLVLGTTYFIMDSINVGSNSFVIPTSTTQNVNIQGPSFNQISLTCEGSGELFENSGGITFLNLFDIAFINTGTRTFINPTASSNPLAQVSLIRCLVQDFSSIGTWNIRLFVNECAFLDNIAGLTIEDSIDFRFINNLMFNTSDLGTTFITFTGTGTTTGTLAGTSITTESGETALNVPSTIGSSSLIRINGASFRGTGTLFNGSGINQTDDRITSAGSGGMPDSQTVGETYLLITETVTISVMDTPVILNGTNWVSGILERVTSTTGGRITYTGRNTIKVAVRGQVTMEKVGGGSDLLELCIFKNGVIVNQPCFGTENTAPTSVSVSAVLEISTGDFFELYVSNVDGTANIDVSAAILDIGKL